MNDLDAVLNDFTSDLNRVRDLLKLIKNFREFGASTPPDEIQSTWKEAMTLKETAPALRTDLPLLSGSMILYVCGRFEFFARQLVEAVGDEIAGRAASYAALPSNLRGELKRRTLEIARAPGKYGFSDAEVDLLLIELARNLDHHSGTPADAVTIGSRILSVTESNLRSDVLQDLMKRVGIVEVWREAGKQAKLKSFLQRPSDTECASAAKLTLDNLMKARNQIAHPTGDTSFPDPDKVLWSTDYLEELASVLVDLCRVYLSSLASNAVSDAANPFA